MHISRETESVIKIPGLRIHTIPKVASGSIKNAFREVPYEMVSPDEKGPEYRWMCIRHPLDRIVSAWAFFCFHKGELTGNLTRLGYTKGMPFDEFFNLIIEVHDEDRHTCGQFHYAGPHKIDRYVKLHNLSAKWKVLEKKFPVLNKPLQWLNPSQHQGWQRQYSVAQFDEAMRVFNADQVRWYGG